MASNTEIEMRWVDAWNDLFDIVSVEERWRANCLLPDGSVVDCETCQECLQASAYEGYCLKVEAGWVNGKCGVIASRFSN
jgi:hypothetical protein